MRWRSVHEEVEIMCVCVCVCVCVLCVYVCVRWSVATKYIRFYAVHNDLLCVHVWIETKHHCRT